MTKNIIVIGTGRLPALCAISGIKQGGQVICIEPEMKAFSPLASVCQKNKVPYFLLTEKAELNKYFAAVTEPTVVISAYNAYLFPKKILLNPNLEIVNFHNSLLPKHRGRNAPTWAIYNLDDLTGATWHRVTNMIDQGEVVIQEFIPIPRDINAIDLTLKTIELGATLFEKIIGPLAKGGYRGAGTCTFAGTERPNRNADIPNEGILELKWSAQKVSAFLRSMDYGKLKVFPPPRLLLLGCSYIVNSYCIDHLDDSFLKSITLSGDTLIIEHEIYRIKIKLVKDKATK